MVKLGRPKGSAKKDSRYNRIQTTLNDAELQEVKEAVTSAETNVSRILRILLMRWVEEWHIFNG